MQHNTFNNASLERARKIKMLVLDVDGVLSDGRITYSESGEELKSFHTLDGQGLQLLRRAGFLIAVVTGRKSVMVSKRCQDLGIQLIAQGREDKFVALNELLSTLTHPPQLDEIAHMGDDLPDLLIMNRVGLALTVANAHPEVASRSHWQSTREGGFGAVREACDALLIAQDKYHTAINSYVTTNPVDSHK